MELGVSQGGVRRFTAPRVPPQELLKDEVALGGGIWEGLGQLQVGQGSSEGSQGGSRGGGAVVFLGRFIPPRRC